MFKVDVSSMKMNAFLKDFSNRQIPMVSAQSQNTVEDPLTLKRIYSETEEVPRFLLIMIMAMFSSVIKN